jgi:transketolase
MNNDKKELFHEIANAVRQLSMEAVEKANSGHPGLPMGCAELGAYLWGEFMRYNPKNPKWFNRDRFVLSAGHGSMFLYSLLHLSGYDVTLEDIKNFRQLNSRTPGHPEILDTDGVEATTGPLGQGVANAVGMALSYKILADRFNREGFPIVDNKIICLAGDGCLMEGVSSEASSFAGHLCLNNLILVYDMNYVTLDGFWKDSCSDDQILRYKSYGWDVVSIEDANDIEQVEEVFSKLRGKQEKPTIVIAHTKIGFGSPHKAGTCHVHGSPLGKEELEATKKNLGLPEEEFYVPRAVREFFEDRLKHDQKLERDWQELFDKWKVAHKDLYDLYKKMEDHHIPKELKDELLNLKLEDKISGRKVSEAALQVIAKYCPYIIGGSSDLSGSDCTSLKNFTPIKAGDFSGRNIRYGIREFAMTAMMNGISTTLLRPYGGTFFCFYDYCRNAVRLAAISRHPIISVFTHDSIMVGEDGPTHQPVEHLASGRAVPNLYLFRPGDAFEAKGSWWWALNHLTGPSALVFTRQALPSLTHKETDFDKTVGRGAYILVQEDHSRPIDFTFIGTGSELHLAVDVSERLRQTQGKNTRVVSMPCMRLFEDQDLEYREHVLGGNIGQRVSIEAGSSFGWDRYVGPDGIIIGMDSFGKSAPQSAVAEYFGFTTDRILERIMTPIRHHSIG